MVARVSAWKCHGDLVQAQMNFQGSSFTGRSGKESFKVNKVHDFLHMRLLVSFLILPLILVSQPRGAEPRQKWTEDQANQWYGHQPWLVGANFLPSDAVNELEMWQAATFDEKEIDRELGWAEGLGMNTMRVFLHNLPWEQDPAGFQHRIDRFLAIASAHHIKPIFVLFDSCWDPDPLLG